MLTTIIIVYVRTRSDGTHRSNVPMVTNPLDSNDIEKTDGGQPEGEMHHQN